MAFTVRASSKRTSSSLSSWATCSCNISISALAFGAASRRSRSSTSVSTAFACRVCTFKSSLSTSLRSSCLSEARPFTHLASNSNFEAKSAAAPRRFERSPARTVAASRLDLPASEERISARPPPNSLRAAKHRRVVAPVSSLSKRDSSLKSDSCCILSSLSLDDCSSRFWICACKVLRSDCRAATAVSSSETFPKAGASCAFSVPRVPVRPPSKPFKGLFSCNLGSGWSNSAAASSPFCAAPCWEPFVAAKSSHIFPSEVRGEQNSPESPSSSSAAVLADEQGGLVEGSDIPGPLMSSSSSSELDMRSP